MIETARKILAALSALALVAVATPSSAQAARPLTPQERTALGLDIVRYCAPQIAAWGRYKASNPKAVAALVKWALGQNPSYEVALRFSDAADRLTYGAGKTPVGRAEIEVELCLYGRALALDPEGQNALGWITFQNNSAVDATFAAAVTLPDNPDRHSRQVCGALKNGGVCTLQVAPGNHKITGYPETVNGIGTVVVARGQQSVVVYGDR
jgi:hypothetical protein